jgi:hypothetical protein
MSAYVIGLPTLAFGLLAHSDQKQRLANDGETSHHEELDIYVKSGDYFAQLATVIDALQDTQITNTQLSRALNGIVLDLLYLQAHYEIKRR